MGEINILSELKKENTGKKETDLAIYADALRLYVEAAKNVKENGAICAHPRTGTPLENPYLKVMASQGKVLASMRHIRGDSVIQILQGS